MQSFVMRTTKTLIRLRVCAVVSESSLGAYVRRYFLPRGGAFSFLTINAVILKVQATIKQTTDVTSHDLHEMLSQLPLSNTSASQFLLILRVLNLSCILHYTGIKKSYIDASANTADLNQIALFSALCIHRGRKIMQTWISIDIARSGICLH